MGDMGEVFNAMREHSKVKRANNRDNSAQLLREAGIPFESKNDGAHLIVAGRFNFWPGTGLWMGIYQKSKRQRNYGVANLIREMNKIPKAHWSKP